MRPDELVALALAAPDRAALVASLPAGLVDDEDALVELAKHLFTTPEPRALELVRHLVHALTTARAESGDGCGEDLYALVHVLFEIGEAGDVELVYAAKHANFDAGCMIERELLTMSRDRATMLSAVASLKMPVRDQAALAADVRRAFDAPDRTRTDLTTGIRSYFGIG